jgi:hypothetical protein
LLLGGLRAAVRAECWRLCVPPSAQLTRQRAFSAFLAGDALGNVTPLGLLASEATKVFLTRHHMATRAAVASLAIENLAYTASVAVMIVVGLLVMVATVPLPGPWRTIVAAAVFAFAAVMLAVPRVVRILWSGGSRLESRWRDRLAQLADAVSGFSRQRRARLTQVFALELAFHALAVLEMFLTLSWLLGDRRPSLAQAIVFETLNRIVTVAFKFVPFRIGVDEAFSGAVAPLLAVNPAAGVTLAVVRKVRNLFWAAIGLLLMLRRDRSQ